MALSDAEIYKPEHTRINDAFFVANVDDGVLNLRGCVVQRTNSSTLAHMRKYKVLVYPGRVGSRVNGPDGERAEKDWFIGDVMPLPVKRDSDGFPAPGTRVIGFASGYHGQVVPGWVANEQVYQTHQRSIVVESGRGDGHGIICSEWIVLPDDAETALVPASGQVARENELDSQTVNYMKIKEPIVTSVLDSLTDDQKKELAQRALSVARDMGYCDETKNVLRSIGLPVNKTVTLSLDVEVELPDNEDTPVLSRLKFVDLNGQESTRFVVKSVTNTSW